MSNVERSSIFIHIAQELGAGILSIRKAFLFVSEPQPPPNRKLPPPFFDTIASICLWTLELLRSKIWDDWEGCVFRKECQASTSKMRGKCLDAADRSRFFVIFSICIRGDKGDYAVLCTGGKTYEVREAETSNTLLLSPDCLLPVQLNDHEETLVHKQVGHF